jgi:hypothetical protein
MIQEYKHDEKQTSGPSLTLIRNIVFLNGLWPLHAVELRQNRFIGSCGHVSGDDVKKMVVKKQRRARIDQYLESSDSYKSQLQQSTVAQSYNFNNAGNITVCHWKDITRFLVADTAHNRIVILHPSEQSSAAAREIDKTLDDCGLKAPRCVYFDGSLNRLFVGEGFADDDTTKGRILVFDNVI